MTVRRYSRNVNDPEALAARLPAELSRFTDDYRTHMTAVADWLNTQVPGMAEYLTLPVMKAAGLSAAEWFKYRLSN